MFLLLGLASPATSHRALARPVGQRYTIRSYTISGKPITQEASQYVRFLCSCQSFLSSGDFNSYDDIDSYDIDSYDINSDDSR